MPSYDKILEASAGIPKPGQMEKVALEQSLQQAKKGKTPILEGLGRSFKSFTRRDLPTTPPLTVKEMTSESPTPLTDAAASRRATARLKLRRLGQT